ncbi:NUDIX hydrolase N-terminal domain-containing protein [Streptococcus sp. DD13]|uniref:NUDIX hydrolase N-terminal domain-containing protein n=1 Tax=Streptococcus sp. DD13 TaxID=1777881 RepID=UPI0007950305|nr:NUDIX hydrolase [Streptococcus sp. DD13]KXT79016.1 ADP-ribose pyrophosphatase [Streptococcus sp. DD13]
MSHKDEWLTWATKLQSLAQNGLAYTENVFDRERFEEIRQISVEMLACASGLPEDKVRDLFANETGYQTPKIDTRAAIIKEGRILLVQENNGTWSLPGGWCDVDQSVLENVQKEAKEEAGLEIAVERLVAVLDKRKNNPVTSAHYVTKLFFLCRELGGQFEKNNETLQSAYFSMDQLPPLAEGKNTVAQLQLCFEAAAAEHWETVVD